MWEINKNTRYTSQTREPRCRPFPSRLPQGFKEQTRQRNKDKQQRDIKSTALEQSVKKHP